MFKTTNKKNTKVAIGEEFGKFTNKFFQKSNGYDSYIDGTKIKVTVKEFEYVESFIDGTDVTVKAKVA